MKTKAKYRIVKDSFGEMKVPANKYWGAQTQRSLQNFTINDEKMPKALIKSLVLIKKACAMANAKAKKLDQKKAKLIVQVCDEILSGQWSDNFPLSVWQTGSGTQTNMNVNEVIANRACCLAKKEKYIHPNDDVNMSQSTNDVFPTGIHVMCALLTRDNLIPNLDKLIAELTKLQKPLMKLVKGGRTHVQDATPISLGQEISAWTEMLKNAKSMINDSLKYINHLPLGGTAVGTGLNTPKNFDKIACDELSKMTKIKFVPMVNNFHGLSSKDACSFFSGALKVLAESLYKIANDVRWLASGPNCGLGEITIPANEPGSSIMPGKVNPTQSEAMCMLCIQVIANNTAVSIANTQGNFQLNVFMPSIAYNLNQSLNLLADGIDSFTKNCVVGIKPNIQKIKYNLDRNLMLVTALNTKIGYDKASYIVKNAIKKNISLRESAIDLKYLTSKEFDEIVKPEKMI